MPPTHPKLSSYDLLRLVEEMGFIGTWAWNLQTSEMQWSSGMFGLLGLDPNKTKPSYALVQQLVHPDDREAARITPSLRPGVASESIFRIIRPDGELKWLALRWRVIFTPAGKPDHLAGIVTDCTAQQEAGRALSLHRRRMDALFSAFDIIVWTASADGRLQEGMQAWTQFTSLTVERTLADGWLEAIHEDDRAAAAAALDGMRTAPAPYRVALRVLAKDGRAVAARSYGTPLMDANEAVEEWIGVLMPEQTGARAAEPAAPAAELTGPHIRAARALLNWSAGDLARKSGVSVSTVRRLEDARHPPSKSKAPAAIRQALESAGVEFAATANGKLGLAL